jgi:hypothetical protein
LGFIGKGPELYLEYLKAKFFNKKIFDVTSLVDNKIPEDDIRKIIA